MHELSIAEAILGIVEEHAGGRVVTRVEVEVGHLRQVMPDALRFVFQLVAQDTVADGADLVLHEIAVKGCCRACGALSWQKGFPLRCASCGAVELEIVSGEELLVESIEVTDEQPVLEKIG
jgi:hydrogenase nickel incorporation protein HypA/HybF